MMCLFNPTMVSYLRHASRKAHTLVRCGDQKVLHGILL